MCSVGHVIVMGGIDNQNSIHSSVEVLDPQTQRWSFLANMDQPRMDCAAVVVSDSVLVSPRFSEFKPRPQQEGTEREKGGRSECEIVGAKLGRLIGRYI